MTASAPPPAASPSPPSRRPSLMATGNALGSEDDHGFSVSILSAASSTGGQAAAPAARSHATRSQRRKSFWWLGVVGVGLALLAAARWQQPDPVEPARATAAPIAVMAPLPAPSVSASEPALATEGLIAVTGTAIAAEASAGPAVSEPAGPTRNPFEKLAVAPTVPPVRKAATTPSSGKPAASSAAPARPTPAANPPRDRDAELVAALMANADAGREITAPQLTRNTAQLTAAERNRFAAELRQCQQRNPASAAARDTCRAQACQLHGYVGRTKSCPAAATPRSPAEPAATTAPAGDNA